MMLLLVNTQGSNKNPQYGTRPAGVTDFAGSGVVHMFGGGMSLCIAKVVKSRKARFFKPGCWDGGPNGNSNLKNHTDRPQLNENDFRQNDPAWTTLGCFLLWLGW